MRKLPFAFLLPLALSGQTFVNSGHCQSGLFSCTISLSVTAGNAIFAGLSSTTPAGNTLSVSDGVNTYSALAGSPWTDSGTTSITGIWTAVASTTTTLTITCAVTSDTNYMSCVAGQYSGSPAPSVDRVASASNASGMSFVTGTTATTSAATEVLVGIFGLNNPGATTTSGTGYTFRDSADVGASYTYYEDQTVASTGAYQAAITMTTSGTGTGVIFTLESASSGPPPAIRRRVVSQ